MAGAMMAPHEDLNRSLNFVQLAFYGIGSIVGAGVYSVIGAAAGDTGNHLWLSFITAGFAAFLTALSYAEMASMFPKSGAEYQFLKRAFPDQPIFSFMAGWLIALNAAATSATVALAFAGYLNVFISTPQFLTGFMLLAACTAINIAGIRESTWVGISLVCIEIMGLLIIIWSGFESGGMTKSFESPPGLNNAPGIFAAAALIFFVYIGFEDVANLSEETKNPQKNVPNALLFSVFITSILYVFVAVSVIAISDPQSLAASNSPLTDVAGAVAPWRGQALGAAALFATASTALISLLAISRMLFAMARDGDMPKLLSRTWTKKQTPWVASLVLFGAACLLLLLGQIKMVASISSFGVLMVFTAVQISVIALRYSQPDTIRPFSVPLALGRFPILPAIGIIMTLALITQFEPVVYLVGGGVVTLGVMVFMVQKKWLGS
ncbi:MAG: basic amino acid/polyamine antiporter, APA family [Alphaproteobacteria bacterium]|nr:basic amino acid/polyamine antiporter, APA family [Alphaproteobacteria bacterium]